MSHGAAHIPAIAYLALAANALNLFFVSWMERSAGGDFTGSLILAPALICGALRLPILLGAMIYVVALFYRKRDTGYAIHALVVTMISIGLAVYTTATRKGGSLTSGLI
jgi:hypothetical protein